MNYNEFKKAYKDKALFFHPDKNGSPDVTEHFKLIQNAYETLNTARGQPLLMF